MPIRFLLRKLSEKNIKSFINFLFLHSVDKFYLFKWTTFSPSFSQEEEKGYHEMTRKELRKDRKENETTKEQQRLGSELSAGCDSEDGTCNYDYDGAGAARGDGLRLSFEQIVLFTNVFLGNNEVFQCLKVKGIFFFLKPNFEKENKCIGWGEIAEIIRQQLRLLQVKLFRVP